MHQARDADLIDHFGELPRTRGPEQRHCFGEVGNDRFGSFEWRRFAAAHYRQRAVLRPRLAAGYRRVDEMDAFFCRRAKQFARDIGRSGGVVDVNAASGHAFERAARAQGHRAQVGVVTDAGEHDGSALGGGFGCVRRLAAVFRHPGIGLGARAVIYREFVAVLGQEARHRKAHDAQAEECDFCHCVSP